MDAAAGHVLALGHRDPRVTEVMGADPGRRPLIVDEGGHGFAEAVTRGVRHSEVAADFASAGAEVVGAAF